MCRTPTVATTRVGVFEAALPSGVKRIVLPSAVKSCKFDSLSTSFVRCSVARLLPYLTAYYYYT